MIPKSTAQFFVALSAGKSASSSSRAKIPSLTAAFLIGICSRLAIFFITNKVSGSAMEMTKPDLQTACNRSWTQACYTADSIFVYNTAELCQYCTGQLIHLHTKWRTSCVANQCYQYLLKDHKYTRTSTPQLPLTKFHLPARPVLPARWA